MSVRSFPMPVWANRGDGWCAWCGETVAKPARTWHPPCLTAYQLHTWPDVQRHHVVRRDGETCWDCKAAPEKWVRDRYVTTIGIDRKKERWPEGEPLPRYVGIRRAVALELEHETPLWSVAHLPPEERRPFFGPENLRLRCPPCHKAKTAREAAERAALKVANQNTPAQPKENAA